MLNLSVAMLNLSVAMLNLSVAMLNLSVAMTASTCQDETFTVSPSSPQMITHTYSNHDNCTWTVNVAVEYGQVSSVPSLSTLS